MLTQNNINYAKFDININNIRDILFFYLLELPANQGERKKGTPKAQSSPLLFSQFPINQIEKIVE